MRVAYTFAVPARVIDQNLSHQSSGDPEQLYAITRRRFARTDQPQVRFVNERCRLKCVVRALSTQTRASDPPQLVVDERQ